MFDRGASLGLRGVRGGATESIPQGLKPQKSGSAGRPKAEALGYLDASAPYQGLDAGTPYQGLDARVPYQGMDARTPYRGVGARAPYRGMDAGTLYAARVAFALLVSCFCLTACAPPKSSRITIGAKNFTEQVVLGELLSQEIEAVTGEPVARRFYLAGSYLCQQALVSGRIDGYVEYTGTALTAILKQPLPPVGQRDEATVFRRVSELYGSRYGVKVGRGLGFEDTFAMVVRGEDARRLGLRTISDAVSVSEATSQNRDVGHPDPPPPWRLGVGYEFESRPDGLPGLEATYGLKFAGAPRTMDLGLLYRALSSGQVDMVAGNSTDGPIRALGFVVLEDDRHYFPPYEAVPLVREDSLGRHPGIQVAMDRLAGKVSAEEVRGMNYAVDSEHKDVGEVVREFRKGKGL
jgi:osmoprotectant transport system substrate-binding protein